MNRKTIKTRTGAYHVTLPIRLVEEFDELLSFKASRSKAIAYLMRKHIEDGPDVGMMETKNVLASLMTRFEPGTYEWNTLKVMYDTIVSLNDDPSSS